LVVAKKKKSRRGGATIRNADIELSNEDIAKIVGIVTRYNSTNDFPASDTRPDTAPQPQGSASQPRQSRQPLGYRTTAGEAYTDPTQAAKRLNGNQTPTKRSATSLTPAAGLQSPPNNYPVEGLYNEDLISEYKRKYPNYTDKQLNEIINRKAAGMKTPTRADLNLFEEGYDSQALGSSDSQVSSGSKTPVSTYNSDYLPPPVVKTAVSWIPGEDDGRRLPPPPNNNIGSKQITITYGNPSQFKDSKNNVYRDIATLVRWKWAKLDEYKGRSTAAAVPQVCYFIGAPWRDDGMLDLESDEGISILQQLGFETEYDNINSPFYNPDDFRSISKGKFDEKRNLLVQARAWYSSNENEFRALYKP
jgi:hypothetical protein